MNFIYTTSYDICTNVLPLFSDHAIENCQNPLVSSVTTIAVGTFASLMGISVYHILKGRVQSSLAKSNLVIDAVIGNLAGVRKAINQGYDLNSIDGMIGYTALFAAAVKGHTSVVKELLNAGADPNIASADSRTALHVSCSGKYPGITSLLLQKGANPNIKDAKGNTPLMTSIIEDVPQCAEILLESPSLDLNVAGEGKKTALHLAAKNQQKGVLKKILQKGGNPDLLDEAGELPLHIAAREGSKEIVELLLEKTKQADTQNLKGETPFFIACLEQLASLWPFFLDKAELNLPNHEKVYPIHLLMKSIHLQSVVDLLNSGKIDLTVKDPKGNTPAHIAANSGSKQVLQVLFEKKVSFMEFNSENETPFSLLLKNGKDFQFLFQSLSAEELMGIEIDKLSLAEYSIIHGFTSLGQFLASKGIYFELTKENQDKITRCMLQEALNLLKSMQALSPVSVTDLNDLIQEMEKNQNSREAKDKSEPFEQLELGIKHYLETISLQNKHDKQKTHVDRAEWFGAIFPVKGLIQEVIRGTRGEFLKFLQSSKEKIPPQAQPFLARPYTWGTLIGYVQEFLQVAPIIKRLQSQDKPPESLREPLQGGPPFMVIENNLF